MTIRVLSIDGGGIRAMIPAMVLADIEEKTGKRISEMFDLVAGTSSGGIVALGLVHPEGFTAAQLANFFIEEGPVIFRSHGGVLRQIVDEKYPHEPIEGVLKRYFGDFTLADAQKPVIVPCYDVERAAPRFFISRSDDKDGDVPMWKIARATTAAPTFFESFKLDGPDGPEALIDGGMIANNPGMVALTEVTHYMPEFDYLNQLLQPVMMLSLGTGRLRQYYHYEQIKDWGALEWARPAIEITITGAVETVHHQLEQLLRSADERLYYRLQTDVPDANRAMDDASPENLAVIQRLARDMIEQHRADLDQLVEQLIQT